jgi:hypothetical protein
VSGQAWEIKNEVGDAADTLQLNTLSDGTLAPHRKLLQETLIQAVTERRIAVDPDIPFDEQLVNTMRSLQDSDAYKALSASGDFSGESVGRLLDGAGLQRLPVVSAAEHTTMMVTGGPATGKTALRLRLADALPEEFADAVQINPDDYRAILAPPSQFGVAYADMAHREASGVSKEIMARLEARIPEGRAPHVLLDVVAANPARMQLAMSSSHLVVVGGTLDPEIAVQRSYERGLPKIDPVTGEESVARQTPTEVVLDGARKASSLTPDVFQHPNLDFELYDTNVPRGTPAILVAEVDPETRRLIVHQPDTFVDYLERRNINANATDPEQLFQPADRSPRQIGEALKRYTERGISVDINTPDGFTAMSFTPDGFKALGSLESARGVGFYQDMSEAFPAIPSIDVQRPNPMDVVASNSEEARITVVESDAAHIGGAANIADNATDALSDVGKKAGLIGGGIIGAGLGIWTLVTTGNVGEAAEVVYETVMPYGETQIDLASGDVNAAGHSATVETASNVAGIGGAAIGGALGTILIPIPGVGTMVGAAIGGIVAGVGVGMATDFVLTKGQEIVDGTMNAVNGVGSAINGTVDAVGDVAGNVWNGITSFFNGEAGKTEPEAAPVNTPSMRDTNRFLSEVSAEQAEGLSPETQSLYELRSDFARFWGQFNDLVEQGSLGEIMRDMQGHVGENLRGSEPLLAQQDRQFTQRLQSGGNLAFG